MDAIELNAIAHDGTVTVILPELYRKAWNDKLVRVLLIKEDDPQPPQKGSLLAHLRQIKISGPTDFSENIDAYLNGEKDA
ncbi:hypothetical protein [Candidatus Contendibacter odensensis]|uniref:Uncharacterized protein n=1 Tax=Candidatus Contendobacter odensis Run_B_J11 TaxID=1400861 RepID=A0A7U7GA16_9GAMM|nr:hypothetical protein [Candidatus Contendobacter odensis]CDH44620.1 conserved hypothetical protein [Candidatus Contendobacter odensis Run_B_J11]